MKEEEEASTRPGMPGLMRGLAGGDPSFIRFYPTSTLSLTFSFLFVCHTHTNTHSLLLSLTRATQRIQGF